MKDTAAVGFSASESPPVRQKLQDVKPAQLQASVRNATDLTNAVSWT